MQRTQVEKELKNRVIPTLRELGFKGAFPHLYRTTEDFVSLVNFQFFSSGGSFCVNISYADPQRNNVYFKKDTVPKKLTVSQTTEKVRLGADNVVADPWFSYGKTSYGEYRGTPKPIAELTSQINTLLKTHAEAWWSSKCIF